MPYQAIFRGKYSIPQKSNHPLTEARAGDLYFCLEHRLVTIREQPIELTIKEFEIFSLLILNPKRVFTYEMLMDLVWEEDYTYYFRKAVNNHISNLRKKLKVAPDLPEYIKSVYGIGYKFEEKKKVRQCINAASPCFITNVSEMLLWVISLLTGPAFRDKI